MSLGFSFLTILQRLWLIIAVRLQGEREMYAYAINHHRTTVVIVGQIGVALHVESGQRRVNIGRAFDRKSDVVGTSLESVKNHADRSNSAPPFSAWLVDHRGIAVTGAQRFPE